MDTENTASIGSEFKISLTQAARIVPALDGKRPSVSTLWRWSMHGIHGVRLEHVWIGRKIATTREALDRFFAAVANARLAQEPEEPSLRGVRIARIPSRRQRDIAAAQDRLSANKFAI